MRLILHYLYKTLTGDKLHNEAQHISPTAVIYVGNDQGRLEYGMTLSKSPLTSKMVLYL